MVLSFGFLLGQQFVGPLNMLHQDRWTGECGVLSLKTRMIHKDALLIVFREEYRPGTFIACKQSQPRAGWFLTSLCINGLGNLFGSRREIGHYFAVQTSL